MSDVVFADLIDADPAPREVTTTGKRYIAMQAPYVWMVMVILLMVMPGILMLAMLGPTRESLGAVGAGVGLAAFLGWQAASQRKVLRKVLVDGTQRPARLAHVAHLVVRHGFMTGRRVTLTVEVDGKRARCVSWAGDLDDAEPGAWIRVLVHPDARGVVVPVVSVT
jgi:hypothetical protein